MNKITRQQLIKNGCVINTHMPLFGGFYYCKFCKNYNYHYAMSHRGKSDCYAVCKVCDNYTGNQKLIEN